MNRDFVIHQVNPHSPAEKAGIAPGDRLSRINDRVLHDMLDYKYLTAEEELLFNVVKKNGRRVELQLQKQYDEDPGLVFASSTLGPLRKCRNNCIFCFVDQQPEGLRESLYEKDDDYRLSFLYGNYISLTNAGQLDLLRMIRRRISPLYLSVHATNPAVRRQMMRNPRAGAILRQMQILARAGIKMHGQIVLCPGINDGEVLEKTLADLSALYPALETLAIVPVGLSRHREDLFPLQRVDEQTAEALFTRVVPKQEAYLETYGTPFIYLADEFYYLTGRALPAHDHYGPYAQLENGVGMSRLFLRELAGWQKQGPLPEMPQKTRVSLVTGTLAEPLLRAFAAELRKTKNLEVQLHAVPSTFWGAEVSVAGLLTGSDLLQALDGQELGDYVFIPSTMLKENSRLFLDGHAVDHLSRYLNVPLIPVEALQDLRSFLASHASNTTGGKKVPTCQCH